MRILVVLLLVLVLLIQYQLWLSDDGMREVWRLNDAVQAQQNENLELEERNDTLEAEVSDLKEGLDAVEERARSELGMIREDEVFYQLVLERDGQDEEEAE